MAATEREVRQNLISAWQALDSSRLAITANQAQADANQGAVNGVKQEQQAGERSVLDILNAQQELFASQVALAAAQHDGVIGAYRLLSTTGQLTARALHLNTTLYDPEEHYGANADAWFGLGK